MGAWEMGNEQQKPKGQTRIRFNSYHTLTPPQVSQICLSPSPEHRFSGYDSLVVQVWGWGEPMSPIEGSVCPMARETYSAGTPLLFSQAFSLAWCWDAQEPVCGHEGRQSEHRKATESALCQTSSSATSSPYVGRQYIAVTGACSELITNSLLLSQHSPNDEQPGKERRTESFRRKCGHYSSCPLETLKQQTT